MPEEYMRAAEAYLEFLERSVALAFSIPAQFLCPRREPPPNAAVVDLASWRRAHPPRR